MGQLVARSTSAAKRVLGSAPSPRRFREANTDHHPVGVQRVGLALFRVSTTRLGSELCGSTADSLAPSNRCDKAGPHPGGVDRLQLFRPGAQEVHLSTKPPIGTEPIAVTHPWPPLRCTIDGEVSRAGSSWSVPLEPRPSPAALEGFRPDESTDGLGNRVRATHRTLDRLRSDTDPP